MCKSVRGAAFFGSSIHLGLSFIFLSWFVFDTLISEIDINLWKCDPPEVKFRDLDPLAHYLNILFKLFYFIALFVTGVYIFRGVEREKPQILKFAALGFVILQIVAVVLFSIFFTIQWNTEHNIDVNSASQPARLTMAEEPMALALSDSTVNLPGADASGDKNTVGSTLPCQLCPAASGTIEGESPDNVTPMISESVLPAPDINDTTTTTPIPVIITAEDATITTTTATQAPATTTTMPESKGPAPCPGSGCPLPMKPPNNARQRLPHNRLVSLVLQMCFAVTNGVGSVAYAIVLALYMINL